MTLLHCPDVFKYPTGITGQQELETKIASEIPAFLWYLLNEHVIASELQHSRYGIREYANPVILEAINGLAPETELLRLIDDVLFKDGADNTPRLLSSNDLQAMLIGDPSINYQAKKIFSFTNSCGIYLGRLAKSHPDRISKHGNSHKQSMKWKLLPVK